MRISRKPAAAAAFFMTAALVAACGSSSTSIPGNSVATMDGNPITLQAVNHWMYVAVKDEVAQAAEEGETIPVITAPDPPQFADCIAQIRAGVPTYAKDSASKLRTICKEVFDQYMPEAMDYLIEGYWYQADANKLGITFSAKAADKELATVKKQFKTTAAYDAYLKSSGETAADIQFQIRVSGLYNKLLTHWEKPVTKRAITAYYETHKPDFATQATRTGNLIRVKTQAGAAAAVAALKSGTSWDAVAKQYAEDATSRKDGGVITAITPNTYETAVNKVLFSAPKGVVEGPIKGVFGYYVLEVSSETAGTQKTLAQETSAIKSELTEESQNAAKTKVTSYSKKNFGSKTVCRTTYSVSDCANYVAPKTTTTAASSTSGAATSTAAASTSTGAAASTGTSTGAASTSGTTATSTAGSTSTSAG